VANDSLITDVINVNEMENWIESNMNSISDYNTDKFRHYYEWYKANNVLYFNITKDIADQLINFFRDEHVLVNMQTVGDKQIE